MVIANMFLMLQLPDYNPRMPALDGGPIGRSSGSLEPVERRQAVVVAGAGVRAVLEEERNGLREPCPGRVVERRRAPAVAPLPREAPVVHACAVTKEREDVVRVVLSALVSRA